MTRSSTKLRRGRSTSSLEITLEHQCRQVITTMADERNLLILKQWSDEPHAGFSITTPWQRENESYTSINAAAQVGVSNSVFEYWAAILRLRKKHKDIFIYGSFQMLDMEHNDVFAYTRTFEKETVVVIANFREENVQWKLPQGMKLVKEGVLVSSYGGVMEMEGVLSLRPFEAFATFVV